MRTTMSASHGAAPVDAPLSATNSKKRTYKPASQQVNTRHTLSLMNGHEQQLVGGTHLGGKRRCLPQHLIEQDSQVGAANSRVGHWCGCRIGIRASTVHLCSSSSSAWASYGNTPWLGARIQLGNLRTGNRVSRHNSKRQARRPL